MGLETGSYISALVSTNPVGATDPKSQGDDHIRFIKAKILETFPNVTGAVTSSHTELNLVAGATVGLATLSVSFAAAQASISAINTLLSSMGTLSASVTSSDITGSIRTPILQTQGGYTAGTFTAATVVVNNKGIITGITSNTVNAINSGTSVSATGTSIDFTGIPAGTKRIAIMFSAVSTNGTSSLAIQIGDSGGIENTGYNGAASNGGIGNFAQTTLWELTVGAEAAISCRGTIWLNLIDSATNAWVMNGTLAWSNGYVPSCGGAKALTAALDRVRVTTVNGTDSFDAGTLNILYE